MLAGGFREAGSGIPPGLTERLQGDFSRASRAERDGAAERGGGEQEDVALRMELEDVAREM